MIPSLPTSLHLAGAKHAMSSATRKKCVMVLIGVGFLWTWKILMSMLNTTHPLLYQQVTDVNAEEIENIQLESFSFKCPSNDGRNEWYQTIQAWASINIGYYMFMEDSPKHVRIHQLIHELNTHYDTFSQINYDIHQADQYDYNILYNDSVQHSTDGSIVARWKIIIKEQYRQSATSGGSSFVINLRPADTASYFLPCHVQDLFNGYYIACCSLLLDTINSDVKNLVINIERENHHYLSFINENLKAERPQTIATYDIDLGKIRSNNHKSSPIKQLQSFPPCNKSFKSKHVINGYVSMNVVDSFTLPDLQCSLPVLDKHSVKSCIDSMYNVVTLMGDSFIRKEFESISAVDVNTQHISRQKTNDSNMQEWWQKRSTLLLEVKSCDDMVQQLVSYSYSLKHGKRLIIIDAGAVLTANMRPYQFLSCVQRLISLGDLIKERNDTTIIWYDISASIALNPEVMSILKWTSHQVRGVGYYLCEELQKRDIRCVRDINARSQMSLSPRPSPSGTIRQQFAHNICLT